MPIVVVGPRQRTKKKGNGKIATNKTVVCRCRRRSEVGPTTSAPNGACRDLIDVVMRSKKLHLVDPPFVPPARNCQTPAKIPCPSVQSSPV